MVGLGNRQPPPDHTAGGALHFFSLPHWTRRILPASATHRKTPPDQHRRLLLEKDLPPTPPPQDEARHDDRPTSYRDVYHNTPVISPPSQINSVAFTSLPRTSTENPLRKTKSTHSLRSQHPSSTPEQHRTRGISMTHLFGTAKRASTSPAASGSLPATPLIRKSSFWSRKSLTTPPQHLAVPPDSPSLPAPKTASPLRLDSATPPDPLPRSRSNSTGARLSRHHSERAVRKPSATRTDVPGLPQSPAVLGRTSVRPSTADPYLLNSHPSPARRPTTADPANPLRSRSLFTPPQPPTIPPSNAELSSLNLTPRSKIGPPNARPRSSTNPPLLHRLSVNLFAPSSSPVSKNWSHSNGVTSSPTSRSPRPSLSQIPPDILRPRQSESSETFVNRLVPLVSKAEIAGILASSGDAAYVNSLQLFIERFDFHGDPLDVALRRLLMDVGLPRESQQIDRVLEAFANRYVSCNPNIFTSKDHPYILAFSLIMLHTDAFNKSNKRKMTKADYMRNTTLPGLIPEVLDCFYDNIVFAPFIFIEDPLDPEGAVEANLIRPSTSSGLSNPMMQNGNTLLSRPKIDPYYLIMNNLLGQLRVNVEASISPENPFRWDGTGTSWNYDAILLDFSRGLVVQIGLTDTRSTTPFFGLSVGGMASPSLNGLSNAAETLPSSETWTIKFTKVAVLNRKDDVLEGGKKPLNRKWRPYSVALTKSSLLLFRDLSWASVLLSWNNLPRKTPIPSTSFKPDEIISLNGALAVLDRSYSKHLNTFRLTTRDRRHILFQTTEEKEMNEWISRINYASAFKTTGIHMRSLGMTGKVLELTGVAAATSHLHDLQLPNISQPRLLAWGHRDHLGSMDQPPRNSGSHDGYFVATDGCQGEMGDLSAPEVEGASQFKETFDTVKAELAAARISAGDLSVADKRNSVGPESPRLASRSYLIHARVEDLENHICAANAEIDSSMHIAKNIAILTPFQKSTRDRLQDAIQTMSKKIQAMRLDVTKLICHRSILLNDLAVEERNFKHATSVALQAATETLQQRYSGYTPQPSFSSQELPLNRSSQEESPPSGSQSFDSSVHEVFRSALDFGPDWPSSGEAFAASPLWKASLLVDSPTTRVFDTATSGCPSPDEASYLSLSATNQSLPNAPDFPEEQAEEWNKTRAAKRVSLVKLPSDLRMSLIPGKSCRDSLLKEETDVADTG